MLGGGKGEVKHKAGWAYTDEKTLRQHFVCNMNAAEWRESEAVGERGERWLRDGASTIPYCR
jgi:hypothetical protein